MDYPIWQYLLIILLLGAVLGWLLHRNSKKKLTKIMKDCTQQINCVEKERDELTTKIQQSERLNSENKSLLIRLSSMEKGANLASRVLKENKAKLDDAEQNLAKMQQLMEQRDDTVHAEVSSLLVLKNQENQELRVELHDFLEKLELAERKSINDELRTKEIVDLYNNYVTDSRAFKLQVMQSIDKLRSSLKNKHTQCEDLKKEVEFAREEIKISTQHMNDLRFQYDAKTGEYEHKVKKLVDELQISKEIEKVGADEIEIMQGLLEAHEKGSYGLSETESLLQKTVSYSEELKKELATSRKRETAILDEIEIIEALLEAHEQGNQD